MISAIASDTRMPAKMSGSALQDARGDGGTGGNHIRLARHHCCGQCLDAVFLAQGRDELEFEIHAFTPAQRGERAPQGVAPADARFEHRHLAYGGAALRSGQSRAQQCAQAGEAGGKNDLAAFHSITRSARSLIASGIVRLSARAVLRLSTISMTVDCSIGNSPGLAPFNTLTTRSATLR